MRPLAYIRISGAAEQIGNLSLPTQARLIREFAARRGLAEPTIYEESRTAFTDDLDRRPVFARAIAAIERGEFDALICYDQDRLARDASLALLVANRLTRAGCRILLINQPSADVTTPDGKLMYTFGAGISEYYSAQISRKSRAGLAHIRGDGGHIGGLPYGAVRDARYRLHVDPARADTLALLLTLARDRSALAVADALNARQLPPPRRGTPCWRDTTVAAIVNNGRWLLDQPEPWPTLWASAHGRPRLPRGQGRRHRHTLTGLARCACGGTLVMGGRKARRDGTVLWGLHCRNWQSGRPGGFRCPHPRTYAVCYEAALERWLLEIPDLTRVVPVPPPDVAAARARLAERRRVAFKGLRTGGIQEPEYDALIADLDAEEAALPLAGAGLETLAAEVGATQALWPLLPPALRNEHLRALLRLTIAGRAVTVEPRPAFGLHLAALDPPYPLAFSALPLAKTRSL